MIKITEKLPPFKNRVRATLRDAMTNEVIKTITVPNLITDVGEQLILDAMGGDPNAIIKYASIGHSGGITSAGSVLLVSELDRQAVQYNRAAEVGTFAAFYNTAAGNSGAVTEIGFFGGKDACALRDTGTLFNRILISSTVWSKSSEIMLYQKTADFTMSVDLDVKF